MSAIYKRTNPTKPARAGDDIRYGENVSTTVYTSIVLLLRKLRIAEDAGNMARVNNIITDTTPYRAESGEELKSLLMKVKEESEKVVLKFNIQKMKIMVSSPIIHGK